MSNAIKMYFRSGHVSMTPTLSLGDFTSSGRDAVFPLRESRRHILQTFNGSAALHQVTLALALVPGDVVLLPAYCCGAELGPFLHKDCRCEFYDVDENLNADISHIATVLRAIKNVKALMITHYFGFPQNSLDQLLELSKKHNIALIEDCAHALFSSHGNKSLGSVGQFAIFSPRKSLPLTEGGLMVANHIDQTTSMNELRTPASLPRWQRLIYSMQQDLRSDHARKSAWDALFRLLLLALLSLPALSVKLVKSLPMFRNIIWTTADAEGEDAIPIYVVGMSVSAQRVMYSANAVDIIAIRRRNYSIWLDEIENMHDTAPKDSDRLIKPLLPDLPDGCCPLYFPVIVQNPARVKSYLAARDIECFNWWQYRHEAVNWSQFPVATKLKGCVVALPVHQKLESEQIQRAASCLRQSLE